MNFSRLLPNYQRVYTDSTMKGWTKDQLIKHIRMCENNIAALLPLDREPALFGANHRR